MGATFTPSHGQVFGLALHVDAAPDCVGLAKAISERIGTSSGSATDVLCVKVVPEPGADGYWLISLDDDPPIGHASTIQAISDFIVDQYHRCLVERSEHLIIHAGAVEVDGVAVVIPGASMSGKSTLVAALLCEGANYLSDEFAALDLAGNVWPYPRQLAIRDGVSNRQGVPTPAAAFGADVAVAPCKVGLIVDTHHCAEASFDPEIVHGASGFLAVLENAGALRQDPARALAVVDSLSSTTVLRGPRGEAADAARSIVSFMRSPT